MSNTRHIHNISMPSSSLPSYLPLTHILPHFSPPSNHPSLPLPSSQFLKEQLK